MVISPQNGGLWKKVKLFFQTLNLFPSAPPSTDEHELRTQRISTILFIVLLIVSIMILLLYTSLVAITKTVNIQTPTLTQYEQLYSTYSQTLTCTCNRISINYKTFLHVEYTLHQVCNSTFVDKSWIEHLTSNQEDTFSDLDFRRASPNTFQALRTLCELINSTISDSLTQFYSSQYVSASVTPLQLFQSQTQALVDQFRSTMASRFSLSFSHIRDTTQANALYSGLSDNYIMNVRNGNGYVSVQTAAHNGCQCMYSRTCVGQSSIVHYPSETPLFDVPGFYRGCYVIEALLQSTLQCFYDQNCINVLQTYWPPSPPMDVIALDSSLSSQYFENSTVNQLVDNLMIEQWNASAIYTRYYNECQTTQCTYTIQTRNDAIYIVTTLFGIVGGLMTVLKLIVPRAVKIIRKKKELIRSVTGESKSIIISYTIVYGTDSFSIL